MQRKDNKSELKNCEYAEGSLQCQNEATTLIHSREIGMVLNVCEEHKNLIEKKNKSEYTVRCPNCGCYHGVN